MVHASPAYSYGSTRNRHKQTKSENQHTTTNQPTPILGKVIDTPLASQTVPIPSSIHKKRPVEDTAECCIVQ
jgi:hypothetical protein